MGDRRALAVGEDGYSFAELWEQVKGRWNGQSGVIGIVATPTLDALCVLYACLDEDVPVALAHPSWPSERTKCFFDQVGVDHIFDQGWREGSRGPNRLRPRERVILSTSGSTGSAKLVAHTRESLEAAVSAHLVNLPFLDNDCWRLGLPFSHVGGLSVILRCLAGQRAVVVPNDAGDCLWPPTIDSVVPTQLSRWLANDKGPGDLRALLVGGAPLTSDLARAARSRGFLILSTYGMTEMASQIATESLCDGSSRGLMPLKGVEVQSCDGDLWVRGPQLFGRYLGQEAPFDEHGWFPTGDRGVVRVDGSVVVYGRADNLIISGGENISPETVEATLSEVNYVASVLVLGAVDQEWGERVVAMVSLHAHAPVDWESDLQHIARRRLARFEVPKVFLQADIPLLPNGKPDRKRAYAQVVAQLAEATQP